ncbi:MAG: 3'(2'),5'-bisphosphate nucleotidase CysQ [Myxococcales bacterium]|nr:3'(2'),5'-bisphosphate nucleotidase CysQ [Myxococcota bacterium]MDW8281069.1 3'(2'),5'-bisphosphate nucleotidase CysQ [Myxococcales bacterium]
MDLAKELAVACALAREGGKLSLRYRCALEQDPTQLTLQHKADGEPVTAADHAVNALLAEGLRAAFPQDGLLSEEMPDDGSRHTAVRAWLVDPIDGTRDFVAGRPGFAVMIGLLCAGRPVLGVVYQPMTDTLYHAVSGQGAFRCQGSAPPERLTVSSVSNLAAVRMVSSASHRAPVVEALRHGAGIRDEMSIGSVGIKLSLIAAGERDLYVNPTGRTKLWDTCAPEVILREAGGELTDTCGAPLRYEGPLSHPLGLVGSNGHVHKQALERLQPLLVQRKPGGGTRI